jgi:hypothetical protein
MLGRFLEISIHTPEIRESLAFYEGLGLAQAVTSDVWSHHYAVVTDGAVALGLHEYEFSSPSLTWVLPGLARHVPALSDAGLEFNFLQTGEEQFHELGFRDPDNQMATILEARTYSPLSGRIPPPAIGFFREYRYPVRRLAGSIGFWEPLGFVALRDEEDDLGPAVLTSDGIDVCVYEGRPRPPTLVFDCPDMAAAAGVLERRGIQVRTSRDPVSGLDALQFRAPEGTPLVVLPESA